MAKTKIEWAEKVWNPTVGCTKVSQGCKYCYAERIYERFHPGQSFSNVQMIPGRLDQPLHWKKPARVFVDSMSDLFHEDVPFEFIWRVLDVATKAKQHTFMILTKRPQRMLAFLGQDYWKLSKPSNIWLGVSIEDQKTADERIPLLMKTPSALRFVSYEPALGPVDLIQAVNKLDWLDPANFKAGGIWWVIMGCESGPGRRPMDLNWARAIRDQCQTANVPMFFKQAELDGKLVKMPYLDGRQWAEYPEV